MARRPVTIIGVDPSSKRLCAVITTGEAGAPLNLEMQTQPLSRVVDKRCADAYQWTCALAKRYYRSEVWLFLEKPVMGRGGAGSTIPQAQVNGAVQAACYASGIKVVDANNSQWKKRVVGKGNADKDTISLSIQEQWPEAYEMADGNQDLLDAAGIHIFGREVVRIRERVVRRTAAAQTKSKVKKRIKRRTS